MDKYSALKQYFGHSAFRTGQEAAVDALLAGRDVMCVMPTGAGKSVCYQLPALLSGGITLVVSPLISLMKDQVSALKLAGIRAAYLNSSLTPGQYRTALERAKGGEYKLIYVAPERLDTPQFLQFAKNADIAFLIVDEAHCISQWGQDFRPSYLKITEFVNMLPRRPVMGAFTATATKAVRADIEAALGLKSPLCLTTGFDRPNLYFAVEKPKDKYRALLRCLSRGADRPAIVYCSTRKTVDEVCERLNDDGVPTVKYHAGLPDEERRSAQDDFQFDRARVMAATNAFGMGIDKSNVGQVIHYNMPKDVESYYQEAGRAGRDGEDADCILLYSGQDVVTAKWLITHSRENSELDAKTRSHILACELERLRQMTFYSTTHGCLRKFLMNYFGESAPEVCCNCSSCGASRPAVDLTGFRVTEVFTAARPPKRERADNGLMDALKALRNIIARERGVPAYMIFSNAALNDMAQRAPRTLEEFARVNGVGSAKLTQYGSRFLRCIADCLDGPPAAKPSSLATKPRSAASRPRSAANKPRSAANKPRNAANKSAGAPWSKDEEQKLIEEHDNGVSRAAIARAHGRTAGAIHARLKKLGLDE